MLKKFASYYKPHLKLFFIDLFCAFVVSVCNLVYPKVAGKMIDSASLNYVLICSGVLLGIFLLKAAMNYVITYWGHVVGVRIQADMRNELFAHLQKLPFSYYDETKTGSIMSRLEKTSEINAAVESAVSGIRVSKAYTAEKHELEKFGEANGQLVEARSWQYKAMSRFHTAMTLFMDILYLTAFLAGGLFFCYGMITASELTSYVLYVAMLITPIRTFIAIFEQIQEGMTGFRRFLEVMDVKPEEDCPKPVEVGTLKGDIKFDDVSFRYKKETDDEAHLILNNLSLDIKAGKTVALVGPSGGGKTTLCNLIPRFYDIDSGKITVDGIDIKDMSLYDLRRNIGIVAQDVFIFGGTIKENIAYGDFNATDEQIKEAAENANIDEFIESLDDGYDTYVGERGVKLSGGQRQRVAIARAFLKNPPVLILDEATSALDNVTEMQIQEALERLSVGRTTIVVAHRLSTVKNADEIVVLASDGIEERGTHDELMRKNGVYATLYNYQFRNL